MLGGHCSEETPVAGAVSGSKDGRGNGSEISVLNLSYRALIN